MTMGESRIETEAEGPVALSQTRPVEGQANRGLGARFAAQDKAFALLVGGAASLVLVILASIIGSLIWGSLPVFGALGFGFLGSESWNPVTEKFGALAPVFGTVVTSVIAMVIGVPLSLGVAFFLTELCPGALRRPLGVAIELLAAIPSIIYGIWGLFTFAPFMQSVVEPALAATLGNVPLIGVLFSGPRIGIGILTAGIILGIMILPFITSIVRDVFEAVPVALRESAYALGMTRYEVVRHVVLPYSKNGVVGGVMLGLGRALGETMAVTFVIGNAHKVTASLFAPATTISATLANEFTEAVGDVYTSALVALGLILLVISFATLVVARVLMGGAQSK